MKGRGTDVWRDIAGYGGKYQACITGQVRRVFGSGRTRLMTPYKRSRNSRGRKVCRNRLFVKLTDDSGRSKEVAMLKIMAETFLPPAPPGCVPYHKNGIVTDNWVSNIGYISREELGRRTGHISKAQGVVRIGEDGELLETWRSAREAAKHSFMSYQTIIDRCNGFYMRNGSRHGFKRIQAPDGYVYAWDEEGCIRRALRRLAEESSGKPVIVSLEGYGAEPAAPPPRRRRPSVGRYRELRRSEQ